MKCSNHPETDSVAYCGQCGRALCAQCRRDVSGMVYCETCLAARLQGSTLSPFVGPAGPAGPGGYHQLASGNPGTALCLGFIPGVGAIYNGQIAKAMVQVLIFGALIALCDRVSDPFDAIFGLGIAAFYFYMVIDSYQTAKRKALGQPVEEWLGLGDFKMNAPVGAALLIGLGVLFLLDNMGIHVFESFSRFWPVIFIVIGLLLLQRRIGRTPPPPPPPPRGSGGASGPRGSASTARPARIVGAGLAPPSSEAGDGKKRR